MTVEAFFARRPWLPTLALLFFGLAVGLGSAEILLRLFTTDDNVRATASLDIYAPSECCGLALKPNLSRATFWNGKKVYIETDDEGRRVPRGRVVVGKTSKRKVIFCGDSYTFGNEENAADTFPYLANADADRETVNLGVGSYSTFQEVASLEEYISRHGSESVDQVFLCFFIGNDFTDNLPSREQLEIDSEGRIPLEKFHDLCRVHQLDAAVLVIPDKDQVYKEFSSEADRGRPNQVLTELLEELRLPHIDLLPRFLAARTDSDPLYNMTQAGHLSVHGHRVVTQILREYLKAFSI